MTQTEKTNDRAIFIDAYDVMKVSLDAGEEDIKKAYKKQSLLLHPDKNQGNGGAAEQFTQLKAAYDILSNTERKRVYDIFGTDMGEERIEAQIWGTATMLYLAPFGITMLKVTVVGVITYLFTFYWLYWLSILLLTAMAGMGLVKTKGRLVLNEDVDVTKYAILAVYSILALGYLLLSAVSSYLGDMYFLIFLVLDAVGLPPFQSKVLVAVLVVSAGIISYICAERWWTAYLWVWGLGVLLGLSTLCATILVHIWIEGLQTKDKVHDFRVKMRLLKEQAVQSSKSGGKRT